MAIALDQHDGFIWLNGAMVPWKDAKIHVLSHGLHYASSVFEGIRAYNGKPFKLRQHSERLIESARLIDMPLPYDAATLDAAVMQVLSVNNLPNSYVRPFAWRGSEALGIVGRGTSINVAVAAWEWGKYFGDAGVTLALSKWRKTSPDAAPIQSKTAALYAVGTVAKHEAMDKGYGDALVLDLEGYVAECTGANIFFIDDNKTLHTPIADRFLNGITRQTAIELAKRGGYSVVERRIKLEELPHFIEAFVTGSAAEITAVSKIDDKIYPVGPITKFMQTAYSQEVGAI